MNFEIFLKTLLSPRIILEIISFLFMFSICKGFLSITEEHDEEISKIKKKLNID